MSLATRPVVETFEFAGHLLDVGLVSRRQLQLALDQLAHRPFLHLAEILCFMGFLDEQTASQALREHYQAPRLGQILIANGKLNTDQLVESLTLQVKDGQPLGDILLQCGHVTRQDLIEALAEQEQGMRLSTDLFDKLERCPHVRFFRTAQESGNYPFFLPIESAQTPQCKVAGRSVVMLAANSYLGLCNDPTVIDAAIAATRHYGVGTSGSPLLNGTMDLHVTLERKLAEFMGAEACALFSTGFQTNLGVISALVGRSDVVLVDTLAHASIHDACRLSFGQVKRFSHNHLGELEDLLKSSGDRGKLIVVDGVYSMDGDMADLPGIVRLAKAYGARLLLDDAHGFGVLGRNGRGTAEYFGLLDEIDLVMLTFSKALGGIGGCVLGQESVIRYLKHRSRPYIFSASLPPATVAAVTAALQRLATDPSLRLRLESNVKYMRLHLADLGFDLADSHTQIIPVKIGDEQLAVRMGQELLEEGVMVGTVVSPGVPMGQARLRLSLMASHTLTDLTLALEAIERVGKRLGVLSQCAASHQ